MSIIASQFGRPRGLPGRVVGRLMARSNADFNRWVVRQLEQRRLDGIERVVELGPGPGIALEEALRAFPEARVWGVDPSPEMLSQSARRNRERVRSGRLRLVQGDVGALAALAPLDLVLANHVLYFWHEPAAELALLHSVVRPGGLLALGYQLRHHMPRPAQRSFPKEGHVLYDSDGAVEALLRGAGFSSVAFEVKGRSDAPHGSLALAIA
jgi:SAM-dependent methyltransferase